MSPFAPASTPAVTLCHAVHVSVRQFSVFHQSQGDGSIPPTVGFDHLFPRILVFHRFLGFQDMADGSGKYGRSILARWPEWMGSFSASMMTRTVPRPFDRSRQLTSKFGTSRVAKLPQSFG